MGGTSDVLLQSLGLGFRRKERQRPEVSLPVSLDVVAASTSVCLGVLGNRVSGRKEGRMGRSP